MNDDGTWSHFNDVHVILSPHYRTMHLKPATSIAPPPRRGHSSWLFHDRYLIIFGGVDADQLLDDMWLFDLHTLTWHLVTQTAASSKPLPTKRRAAISFQHSLYNRKDEDYAFLHGGEWYDEPYENAMHFWKFKFDKSSPTAVKWIASPITMWRQLKAQPNGYTDSNGFRHLHIGSSAALLSPTPTGPPRLYVFSGIDRG